MKRTRLVLASLATLITIVLLSCGSLENPNSSSDDLNSSQTPTLQKFTPVDEVQATCYYRTYTPTQNTMTVFIDVLNTSGDSGELTFSGPSTSSIAANAYITGIEVYTGTLNSYNGAVLTNYLTIRKGTSYYTTIPWGGAAGKTLETHALDSLPARDTYYVSFNATCLGFGTGIAKYCSKAYSRVTLTLHYCVP